MVKTKKLCENCTTFGCCTNSAAPLVFLQDYKDLKTIGKASSKFLEEIIINGKKIKAVKKKTNKTTCVFFDEDKKRCTIYQDRPFDCRVYPFDILQIDKKYCWIVYSCNPDSDWTWAESYLKILENDKQFEEVMNKIDIFAGNTARILPQESKKTPFITLREVKHKKLKHDS